jgi:heme-degrading monooxygenase HmoA
VSGSFTAGQVVTVFRSRLREDADPSYEALDAFLRARAAELGGLVEVKSFVAEDGERATLVTFADRASHERWARDDEHRAAQRLGRSSVYSAFSIQVAECTSAREFTSPD